MADALNSLDQVRPHRPALLSESVSFHKSWCVEGAVEGQIVVDHGDLLSSDVPKQIRISASVGQGPIIISDPPIKHENRPASFGGHPPSVARSKLGSIQDLGRTERRPAPQILKIEVRHVQFDEPPWNLYDFEICDRKSHGSGQVRCRPLAKLTSPPSTAAFHIVASAIVTRAEKRAGPPLLATPQDFNDLDHGVFFSLTPGPSPFSAMKITPAASSAP